MSSWRLTATSNIRVRDVATFTTMEAMNDFSVSLNAIKARYPFPRWAKSGLDQYTSEACEAFARIFDVLIGELIQLGFGASEGAKLAAFEKAVFALNALNATDATLIETGERDDLCM